MKVAFSSQLRTFTLEFFSADPSMECSIVDTRYKRMSIIFIFFERYACLPFHNICKLPTKVALITKLLRFERTNAY